MNAFEVLGLTTEADQQQVRQAYRTRVKACHPDQFIDQEQQKQAQAQLIQLNLAYEEALRLAAGRQVGFHAVPVDEAKKIAQRLMEQGRYESALLQLGRADVKDDGSAHQAFREAVRRSPDNREYHAWALDAAVAVKKHQKFPYRVADWADGLLHPRKKM